MCLGEILRSLKVQASRYFLHSLQKLSILYISLSGLGFRKVLIQRNRASGRVQKSFIIIIIIIVLTWVIIIIIIIIIVLTWKIVGASKASVIYIYIYILDFLSVLTLILCIYIYIYIYINCNYTYMGSNYTQCKSQTFYKLQMSFTLSFFIFLF